MSDEVKKILVDWKLVISALLFAFTVGGYAITVGKQTATFEQQIYTNTKMLTEITKDKSAGMKTVHENEKELIRLRGQTDTTKLDNEKIYMRLDSVINKLDSIVASSAEARFETQKMKQEISNLAARVKYLELRGK